MPQEPKRKHSKARKGTRRASINLEAVALITCSNCKELIPTHQMCKFCGFYNGRQVHKKTKVQITKA